nr:hypothetical protein [Tanacetum cinerariifolium]
MRIDELHKFNDGTLTDVRTALDDRLKGIQMQYLPQSIWRKSDKDRANILMRIDELHKFSDGTLIDVRTALDDRLKGIRMKEKIKESELLIDQLDLPCDILSEYDSFASQDFSKDTDLLSPDNEDKDFDPPSYELLVFKEVPNSMRLLPFSSENEEKVFKPGIYTSKKVHSCFQSQSDFHKPDEDFSCSKWKEYSSLGCSSVPFLSPLIHSSMGEFGPALRP